MDVVPASLPSVGDNASDDQFEVSTRLNDPQAAKEPSEVGSEQFQILALDGGGAKALFTAHVLARLEQDLEAYS